MIQAAATMSGQRTPIYRSLFVQVVVALVLGIVLGMAAPGFAVGLKFFSDAFLKLISMIVAPIVFCVVVHGIAGAGDLKKVGRVGGKALLYFEVMTTVALAVGLLLAYVVRPGVGMNINTASLDADALSTYTANASKLHGGGFSGFILNIIPTTSFDALARNDVLQVLFFAIIFGVSLALVGSPAKPVTDMIDTVVQGAVPRHGADRARGAAWRAGRGRLHGRPVRRSLAGAAGLAGGPVLGRGRALRRRRAGHDHAGDGRPQHLQASWPTCARN